MDWPKYDFLGVEGECQLFSKEALDLGLHRAQILASFGDQHEIIGVADVIGCFQYMLHEVIEFIQVNIRKELGREVADRDTSRVGLGSVSLSNGAAA